MISNAGTTGTSECGWYCVDEILDAGDRGVQVLLAQRAQRGGAGGAVEGDHPPPREGELAAARQLHAGAHHGEPLLQLFEVPNAAAQGQHLLVAVPATAG